VFASGNDGYQTHRLYVDYFGAGCTGTATGWCWTDLGAPAGTTEMRTPTAVVYPMGSARRVAVFVPVQRNGRWELWGRYSDDRRTFNGWQNFGTPPQLTYTGVSRAGFDLSAGVVYWQGSTLRINLFGTTTPYDHASSGLTAHGGGHLMELFWDGASWRWGLDQQPPGSHTWNVQEQSTQVTGPRIQTMSASVVDTPSWERISVFGEDEFGRTWELAWNGGGWAWQQH
jgi:hypothetical protein